MFKDTVDNNVENVAKDIAYTSNFNKSLGEDYYITATNNTFVEMQVTGKGALKVTAKQKVKGKVVLPISGIC